MSLVASRLHLLAIGYMDVCISRDEASCCRRQPARRTEDSCNASFTPVSVFKTCKTQGSQSTLSLVCHATTTAVRLSSLPSSKARLTAQSTSVDTAEQMDH